ncbi:MAG: hypothetical protein JO352_19050 [Chloroflexi bacterium]|nr:hypothetical protein [Chloroflexota bacterium]MBV9598749.1 hypothetical protein [Chloroflexota bacterium]
MITRLYALTWAAGVVTAVAVETLTNPAEERLVAAMTAMVVSPALFLLYMPFYYTFAASLTVQTLLALDRAGAEGVRLSDLYATYASKQTLRERVESMVASRNLVPVELAYRLTGKGRLVAQVFQAVKNVWALGPGG